jgi:hypothetical protein
MSVFTNPLKVLEHARDTLVSFISGPFWAFVQPVAQIVESKGGQILLTAAENGVIAGATTGNGAAAMAAALASFEKEVVANGVPFIESEARVLIEMALQKAKAKIPAAPVS